MRKIENSDLWSAIRGLNLTSMTKAEVEEVFQQHKSSDLFAGKVIAEAARQVIAGRLYRKD